MKHYKIDSMCIKDWNSFHAVFASTFQFPDYYGYNMNAWIDCMDELVEDLLLIDLGNCEHLKNDHPDILEALCSCTAFVNQRKLDAGELPT